ncbi:MAG: glycosyltransferase family 2 protein [Chitinophagaceae bacterium]
MKSPSLSIITVCFNAENMIEDTLKSVLSQTYPDIEHIIIDGGSTDATLKIIGRNPGRISYMLSEKDNGLYDAMNKGLQKAKGDYILFLNADDTLYSSDTIEEVFKSCENADVYYGEAMIINDRGNEMGLRSVKTPHKVPEYLTWKSLRFGMVVSHQAFIIRRSLALPYDLQYRVCSDIDWMIRCLKQCESICNSHEVICNFRAGGTSHKNQSLAWKERFQIFNKHYGILNNLMNHILISVRFLLQRRTKKKRG